MTSKKIGFVQIALIAMLVVLAVVASVFAIFNVDVFNVANAEEHNSHTICGHAICSDFVNHVGHNEVVEWTEFVFPEDGVLDTDGNYYLSLDTIADKDLIVTANVSLCLHGKQLSMQGFGVYVKQTGTLNLCDCSKTPDQWQWNGQINSVGSQKSVVMIEGGAFNLYGGRILCDNTDVFKNIYPVESLVPGSTINFFDGSVSPDVYSSVEVYPNCYVYPLHAGIYPEDHFALYNTSASYIAFKRTVDTPEKVNAYVFSSNSISPFVPDPRPEDNGGYLVKAGRSEWGGDIVYNQNQNYPWQIVCEDFDSKTRIAKYTFTNPTGEGTEASPIIVKDRFDWDYALTNPHNVEKLHVIIDPSLTKLEVYHGATLTCDTVIDFNKVPFYNIPIFETSTEPLLKVEGKTLEIKNVSLTTFPESTDPYDPNGTYSQIANKVANANYFEVENGSLIVKNMLADITAKSIFKLVNSSFDAQNVEVVRCSNNVIDVVLTNTATTTPSITGEYVEFTSYNTIYTIDNQSALAEPTLNFNGVAFDSTNHPSNNPSTNETYIANYSKRVRDCWWDLSLEHQYVDGVCACGSTVYCNHFVCGSTYCSDSTNHQGHNASVSFGQFVVPEDGHFTTDGYYNLTVDVDLSADLYIDANVAICLSGYNLNVGSHSIIVTQNGTLDICDCRSKYYEVNNWGSIETYYNSAKIVGNYDTTTVIVEGGTLNLYSGTIFNNNTDWKTEHYAVKTTVKGSTINQFGGEIGKDRPYFQLLHSTATTMDVNLFVEDNYTFYGSGKTPNIRFKEPVSSIEDVRVDFSNATTSYSPSIEIEGLRYADIGKYVAKVPTDTSLWFSLYASAQDLSMSYEFIGNDRYARINHYDVSGTGSIDEPFLVSKPIDLEYALTNPNNLETVYIIFNQELQNYMQEYKHLYGEIFLENSMQLQSNVVIDLFGCTAQYTPSNASLNMPLFDTNGYDLTIKRGFINQDTNLDDGVLIEANNSKLTLQNVEFDANAASVINLVDSTFDASNTKIANRKTGGSAINVVYTNSLEQSTSMVATNSDVGGASVLSFDNQSPTLVPTIVVNNDDYTPSNTPDVEQIYGGYADCWYNEATPHNFVDGFCACGLNQHPLHYACGETVCNDENHNHGDQFVEYVPFVMPDDGLNFRTDACYYLTGDSMIDGWCDIYCDLKICLNGYTLYHVGGGSMFRILNDATLTVCDCTESKEGKIVAGDGYGGIELTGKLNGDEDYNENPTLSTFNLYGGSIVSTDATSAINIESRFSYDVNLFGGKLVSGRYSIEIVPDMLGPAETVRNVTYYGTELDSLFITKQYDLTSGNNNIDFTRYNEATPLDVYLGYPQLEANGKPLLKGSVQNFNLVNQTEWVLNQGVDEQAEYVVVDLLLPEGDGTAENPYVVTGSYQFQYTLNQQSQDGTTHIKLETDITLNDYTETFEYYNTQEEYTEYYDSAIVVRNNIDFDLNGHTIYYDPLQKYGEGLTMMSIGNGADVTIRNGFIDATVQKQEGMFDEDYENFIRYMAWHSLFRVFDQSTLNLSNIELTGTYSYAFVATDSNVNAQNVTLENKKVDGGLVQVVTSAVATTPSTFTATNTTYAIADGTLDAVPIFVEDRNPTDEVVPSVSVNDTVYDNDNVPTENVEGDYHPCWYGAQPHDFVDNVCACGMMQAVIVWCEDNFTYNTKDQKDGVSAYYLNKDGQPVALNVIAPTEFTNFQEGGYQFAVEFANGEFSNGQDVENGFVLPTIVSKTFNIKKLDITNAEVVFENDGVFTYNGQEQTPVVTSVKVGDVVVDDYTTQGDLSATFARKYWCYFTGQGNFTGTKTAFWNINKAQIEKPTEDTTNFVYTGVEQTYQIAQNAGYTVSNNTRTLAGSQTVTVSLDVQNYEWTDNTNSDVYFTFSIAKAKVAKPIEDATEFVYNGAQQTYYVQESDKYVVSNNTRVNAGSHFVEIELVDSANYEWEDGSIDNLNYTFTVAKVKLEKPAEDATDFVYNGEEQTYQIAQNAGYTVSNNTRTLAGSQTVTVSLNVINYEWIDGSSDDVTFTFEIAKAQIAKPLADTTVFEYTGEIKTYAIASSDKYTVRDNTRIDAGSQEVTVALVDDENYEWADGSNDDLTFNFTVAKAQIAKPQQSTTQYVYTGLPQNYDVTLRDGYTVSNNTRTIAGTQTVRIALFNPANYEWTDGTTEDLLFAFTIEKATYDMSNVLFVSEIVKRDGNPHSILIQGELPSGVEVAYSGNAQTVVGVYTVTASFVGDEQNYNAISPMYATLTINKSYLAGYVDGDASGDPDVITTTTPGFTPNIELEIRQVPIEDVQDDANVVMTEDEDISTAYDVTMWQDGVEIQPSNNLTIRLLIPEELRGESFRILHEHDGVYTNVDYTVDGNYAVFTVDSLSQFLFVYEGIDYVLVLIILAVILAIEILISIILFAVYKKKKGEDEANNPPMQKAVAVCSFAPIALLGAVVPSSIVAAIALLDVGIVAMLGVIIGFAVNIAMLDKKQSQKAEQSTADDTKQNDALLTDDESADNAENDVIDAQNDTVDDKDESEEETSGVLIDKDGAQILVRYIRSFTAKLIQSSDILKDYYCQLKNHLLSFKGVKVRISWKAATFNVGRKQLAKLTIRGKTLTLHVALDPKNYQHSTFKVIDMSDVKTYQNVPLAYKIKSNRALKNAMSLIDTLILSLGLQQIAGVEKTEVSSFPYEDTKSLIQRGLIKVKAVNGEEITNVDNLIVQPFTLHQSVSVEEAQTEISDEMAMSLIVDERDENTSTIGKKYAVNIDVLAKSFNAGDTVTIEKLKQLGLVPKKEKSVKILARGRLDKALTVEANDFSADAIKMIVLVGGTAKLV